VTDWIELEHEETGGRQKVPDSPDVLAVQASKGWHPVDENDEASRLPFVPAAPIDTGDGREWVRLVHPDLPLGENIVPNNPDALAGAYEAGWRLPDPDPDVVAQNLAEVHPRGGQATPAEVEAAEQDAQLQAALTDDPTGAVPAGDDEGK
jgi:hypothetical protein